MVIWLPLNGALLVLWAARKPVQAINARLLPNRHLSWQALYEDSICIAAMVQREQRSVTSVSTAADEGKAAKLNLKQ